MLKLFIFLFEVICLCLAFAGCKGIGTKQKPIPMATIDGSFNSNSSVLSVPPDSTAAIFEGLKKKTLVYDFYSGNNGKFLWVKDDAFNKTGDSLFFMLTHSQYYGLNSSNYHADELLKVNTLEKCKERALRLEVLLTDGFFLIARDLRAGYIQMSEGGYDSVYLLMLKRVSVAGGLMREIDLLEPRFNGYRALKKSLRLLLDTCKLTDSADVGQVYNLIRINLERWRSERQIFPNRYIFINIPSYMLYVVESDRIVFSSKIVVGTKDKQTPQLNSNIECFTMYPYWTVPRKIAIEEYLPIIQQDSSFVSRNRFDVIGRRGALLRPDSVDWSRFNKNYFPVVLRQREGEENSLGIIKFIFDNPYAVYLHDTNAKRLFNSTQRAFSHGCIRVERAIDLAHYLITGIPGKKSSDVERSIARREKRTFNLSQTMPIYIRYFTAEVLDASLRSYEDVYAFDK